jgi:SRSO17 transposase/transposase
MAKTYTPELDTAALPRLDAYAARLRDASSLDRPARRCPVYLRGLITDGERKSIEPLSRRVPLPPELAVKDPDQALQQSVSQSPWDEQVVRRRYRAVMAEALADPAGILVIDDTTFPKQGRHSVGVQRQHCGALGKKANCQCAVPVHYVGPRGHCPLGMRLYLPESWPGDPKRLAKAAVPEGERRSLTEGQIALELLDRVRGEGLPGRPVIADAGYGVSGPFRGGLARRGLHYVVGVTDEMVVFTEEPTWDEPTASAGGRPQKRHRPAEGSPRPIGLKELAARTPRRKVTWREGTKGPMWGRFAWPRVRPGHGRATGDCAGGGPIWLLIEEQSDGAIKCAFSNLPANTSRIKAARPWRSRWPVERGYQQMEEELGLDHFEGRSWRGFHHHACLVMLAFGLLAPEQSRARRERSRPGKRGAPRSCDHAARYPPGVAAAAGPDLPARLPLLPRPFASETANGVVLDRLTILPFGRGLGTMIAHLYLGDFFREDTIMARPLLPDELWEVIEPLLPVWTPSPKGGQPPLPDRAALTGILKSGLAWEDLPREMNCGCGMTCWRRLRDWQADGTWDKIHKVLLGRLRGPTRSTGRGR